MVYQDFLADPVPEKMPILEDLYNVLREQKEPEAQRIAPALEIYVHGSLNVFNHRTNVDVNNRFVCYDIKDASSSRSWVCWLFRIRSEPGDGQPRPAQVHPILHG
jgi:hypothetical protein